MSKFMIPVSGKDLGTMRDELAKIAYTASVSELGTNVAHLSDEQLANAAVGVARVSYMFADAMMNARMVQPVSGELSEADNKLHREFLNEIL